MIGKLIASKIFPYIAAALLAATIGLGVTVWIQSGKLKDRAATITALTKSRDNMTTIANERATALTGRDATIRQQSESIAGLKLQSMVATAAYDARIASASAAARPIYDRAAQVIQLPAPPADKACEESRKLILEELTR